MKTIHQNASINASTFGTCLLNDMREAGIRGGCRVIRCGAGLVILPDTDTKKDATEGEVIKALGFRNKAEPYAPNDDTKRTNYAVSRESEFWGVVGLTPSQERFLRYIERHELLWDEVRFDVVKTEVENI